MESLKSAIANIIPAFSGTIVKHVGYLFQVDDKIIDLRKLTKDLVAMKEDIKTTIKSANTENSVPTKQVEEWLSKVDAVEKEIEAIQENNRKRRSLWSDYTTSKSAAKKLCEVKSLCDQKATIEVTMRRPPSLAQEMPASTSKSPNLKSALHSIKDDVNGIIGIWGMGGVGKTHLLKQVNNELTKDGAFNVVVFVTCSKECYEEKVQDEIIHKLKLDKSGNMEQKKITIYSFLNQHSFVLLLDDLWSRVDLETIGIPDPTITDGTCKRKVVLTTRSEEVCGQMEVREKIRVDLLNWIDAWSLFKQKVTEETINSDPLIQRCAVDVAKELGGLPLALITIGRAMHDKTDPSEWEQAFELLKKAHLDDVEFSRTNKTVFQTLKYSYDSLKTDTLKHCFLHCSLWPEDHCIIKSELIELWMGLGLIDEPNIHTAYNVGYSNIRRLQAVCLLETIDDDDYAIKMHDVIRDMALWIATNQGIQKNKWIVPADIFVQSKVIEVSDDTEKLSLMYSRTTNVSLCSKYSSTKLSTLVLHDNNISDTKPLQLSLFSELAALDLSCNRLEAFPLEICKLKHLQFLNISKNTRPITMSLPKEFESLTNLKYLLLRKTNCIIPYGVLSKLKALRVLELFCNYHVRGAEDMMRIFPSLEKELQCLPHFQALGISITNMDDFLALSQTRIVPIRWLYILLETEEKSITFESCFLGNSQLQNNLISLDFSCDFVECVKFERKGHEESICHLGRLENLSFRWMYNMKEVVWMGLDPKDVFFRLQVLNFEICHELTSISWIVHLPCIRVLQVSGCDNIKQLIYIDELNNGEHMMPQPSLPFLKKMELKYNKELQSISDSMISFPALEILEVVCCGQLKKLPFETNNPPKKLYLRDNEEWWNNLEMDDISHRSLLQPFFQNIRH